MAVVAVVVAAFVAVAAAVAVPVALALGRVAQLSHTASARSRARDIAWRRSRADAGSCAGAGAHGYQVEGARYRERCAAAAGDAVQVAVVALNPKPSKRNSVLACATGCARVCTQARRPRSQRLRSCAAARHAAAERPCPCPCPYPSPSPSPRSTVARGAFGQGGNPTQAHGEL